MASFISITAEVTNDENYCSLTHDVIDVTSIINLARCDKAGAVSTFLGTTRDFFEGILFSLMNGKMRDISDILCEL